MSKTVRHQRGMVSAIRMESLSAIAGIRTMMASGKFEASAWRSDLSWRNMSCMRVMALVNGAASTRLEKSSSLNR